MRRRVFGGRWKGLRGLGALAFLIGAGVLANEVQAQGTPQDQEACRPDVFRLCSAYIPDVNNIVACLNANETHLNPSCHEVMFPRPEPAKPAHRKVRRKIRQG